MGTSTALHILTPEATQALDQAWKTSWRLAAPPTRLLVSEWADRNRFLPKGTSARPGPWVTESFQREMMDAVLEPGIREVVFMTCTQVVKSEALNNICGYFIDAEPKPIMIIQPTDHAAIGYSKKRIAPMIANCPVLYRKVRQAISRQSGNTVLLKEFDGGFLKLAGANSAVGLRGDPIEVLLEDEIDGYPDDVDGEGDPIEIAERRTDSFDHPIRVKASTPAKPRGFSRIEEAWKRSDQRRYFVPCPFCKRLQPLEWRDATGFFHLVYEKDERGEIRPETVKYLCAHCTEGIPENFKRRMLAAGQWVKGRPEVHDIAGFHLNALYSPWRMNWPDLAGEWVRTKDNPEKLRAFVNLRLAETWDEQADTSIEAHELRARATEKIAAGQLPAGVAVLVAAADVQNDRIEAQIVGFGPGEEAWLLAYEIFRGSPGLEEDPETAANVWAQLDDFFLSSWTHPSGVELSPAVCLVDSGYHSDSVYDFVIPRQNSLRRVFACKGVDYLAKPGLIAEGSTKRAHIRLFAVGTYAAKDRIFARLRITKPGPGYLHLPEWVTDEYLEQLTGEKKIPVHVRRTRSVKRIYIKTHSRNEALDLAVYSHAALAVLQQFVAPQIYRDLAAVHATLMRGQRPESLLPPRIRRMRSPGILSPALS